MLRRNIIILLDIGQFYQMCFLIYLLSNEKKFKRDFITISLNMRINAVCVNSPGLRTPIQLLYVTISRT